MKTHDKELVTIPVPARMAEGIRRLAQRFGLSITGFIQAALISFLPNASRIHEGLGSLSRLASQLAGSQTYGLEQLGELIRRGGMEFIANMEIFSKSFQAGIEEVRVRFMSSLAALFEPGTTTWFHARLPSPLLRELRAVAKAEGVKLATLLREALQYELLVLTAMEAKEGSQESELLAENMRKENRNEQRP